MKWKVNKQGDWRNVKRFMWFPKKIDGVAKWMEWAEIRQFYTVDCGWINWKWVES